VAATNRDLEEMVRSGRFRRDLYYRLKVVHLEIPPLRARRNEIPVLTRSFASLAAAKHGILFPGFSREALDTLTRYDWPGNVRELRNLVDGIVALRPEVPIRHEDLPGYLLHGSGAERPLPALPTDHSLAEREFIIQSLLALRAEVAALRELILSGRGNTWEHTGGRAIYPVGPVRVEAAEPGGGLSLKDVERRTIERALRDSHGNRRQAAQALGMSERTLYRRIKDYGIVEDD
jgi:DNA-binding NtrC family response regulator